MTNLHEIVQHDREAQLREERQRLDNVIRSHKGHLLRAIQDIKLEIDPKLISYDGRRAYVVLDGIVLSLKEGILQAINPSGDSVWVSRLADLEPLLD